MTPLALVGSCGFRRMLDARGPLGGFPATTAMLIQLLPTPNPCCLPHSSLSLCFGLLSSVSLCPSLSGLRLGAPQVGVGWGFRKSPRSEEDGVGAFRVPFCP